MSEISRKFAELKQNRKKAFIPFITAGDPDLEVTIKLVPALENAGSHIVELGIPFSDPLADGPTIQRSSQRALRHGYRLADYMEAIRRIRKNSEIPLILFSYYNPIYQYGLKNLARDARAAGVDGVLVTDMTPEESASYCTILEEHQLDSVFLVAPTSSPDRVMRIVQCSKGFVYLVSRTGVTGERTVLSDSIVPTLDRIKQHTDLPVAVGFGISKPEHVRAIWEVADGAVVGSAIVQEMERIPNAGEIPAKIGDFCRWMTEGAHG